MAGHHTGFDDSKWDRVVWLPDGPGRHTATGTRAADPGIMHTYTPIRRSELQTGRRSLRPGAEPQAGRQISVRGSAGATVKPYSGRASLNEDGTVSQRSSG